MTGPVTRFRLAQAQFAADWDRPEWRARYAVSHGAIPYFGSTTHAELRELCGQWNNYTTFDFAKGGCLPQRMEMAGFQTTAMHAFDGGLFQRDEWWTKLAFQKEMFGPDLIQAGLRPCGDHIRIGAQHTEGAAANGTENFRDAGSYISLLLQPGP